MTNQSNEKSKNGKRLALILLALLLIAAIAFGAYTYSKYVTNQKGTDSATVAMWGYTISVKGDTTDDTGFFETSYANATGETIISSISSNNLVAPGSSGSVTITASGKSEVNAKLSMLVEDGWSDIFLTVTKADSTSTTVMYYPVLFTLADSKSSALDGCENVPLAVLVNNIKAADFPEFIESSNAIEETYTLSWSWASELSEGTTAILYKEDGGVVTASTETIDGDAANALDTVLGQLVYNNANEPDLAYNPGSISVNDGTTSTYNITTSASCITLSFTLKITVEQVFEGQTAGD